MTERTTIIIGGGIAGLSAGCYGRMNGYRTQIFESHVKVGGLCTSWKRKGYTIGTSGWVTGSGPEGNDLHGFWRELGAVQDRTFVDYEEYSRVEGRDGKVFILYTNLDRLEEHMLELAPEDASLIRSFIKAARGFTTFKMDLTRPAEHLGALDKLKMMMRFLPVMLGPQGKWMRMTVGEFGARFKNPFMREVWTEGAVNGFFFDPDIALSFVLFTLAYMHLGISAYPLGGAGRFVEAIERRYLELGGELCTRSPVEKILVEDDRACGVRLADGTEHRADVVISAADGRRTIFDMLDGRYVDDTVRKRYDSMRVFDPLIFISIGVARTFEAQPPSVAGDIFPLDEPITVADRQVHWLAPHIYDFDPGLAPEGKTLFRVMLPASYRFWRDLRHASRDVYKIEKKKIADQVIARMDERYPGFAGNVDMVDVSTPVTFERYTGGWQGSPMGWFTSPQTMTMSMDKTLPGLDGFYMIGQWTLSGSLAMAATSGRHVTQIICRKDGRAFRTSVPGAAEAEDLAA